MIRLQRLAHLSDEPPRRHRGWELYLGFSILGRRLSAMLQFLR